MMLISFVDGFQYSKWMQVHNIYVAQFKANEKKNVIQTLWESGMSTLIMESVCLHGDVKKGPIYNTLSI